VIRKIQSVLKAEGWAGLLGVIHRRVLPYRPGYFRQYKACFENKLGLEIGGPSGMFKRRGSLPIYAIAGRIDNCNFGHRTTWEGAIQTGPTFHYDKDHAPGHQYVAEATRLDGIASSSYDFVLSSHTLEHSANPLQALSEWMRVLKEDGLLVLALPHRDGTFDHRRPVTPLTHLVQDFERRTAEDDLTHLDEILRLHDLSRDPEAGDAAQFAERSKMNFENRCLHQHVFDTRLAVAVVNHMGLQILAVEAFRPHDILLLTRKPKSGQPVRNDRFMPLDGRPAWRSPFRSDRRELSA
jgi:SAM-dependent methyltransferase